jgi:hypothetical protein
MLEKYDFFVIIGTGGYMLIWLVIFSALHYIISLGMFFINTLKDGNIKDFRINEVIVEIVENKMSIYEFVKFINGLENIFRPYIRLILRILLCILFLFVSISVLETFFSGTIPPQELYGRRLANYIMISGGFVVFFVFMYLILKISINMREILTLEIKQAKLDIMGNKRQLEFLNEIERYILDKKQILISTKDLADIISLILIIILTTIVNIMS